MNLQSAKQIKIKRKINTFKIVSVFLILWFVFGGLSFAQTTNTTTQSIDDLAKIAHFLVSFFSRWRAILATLAGKAMSNDRIYWTFMHLDVFLRKTWNVMKNFANYTLWFVFLYMIIKSIIDINKDWWSDLIKKKLVWFVVAGILIQASRFILWAVIDISTIAVTAIWAIPWQILQSDMWLQKNLTYMNALWWANMEGTWEIMTWTLMTFDPNIKPDKDNLIWFIKIESKALNKPITQDNYLDMILPSNDTIAWPLIFFGTSIFQFQNDSFYNPQTTSSRKWLMEFSLNLIIIVAYSLALFALLIINIFRIFYLWIVIIFSPFIILLEVFNKMKILEIKWLEKISVTNIIKLIFKPVVFIAYISLMMIFVIWVRSILIPMNWWEIKLDEEITMSSQEMSNQGWWSSYNSSIKSEWLFNFSINWAKKSISDLIVCFVTLFLMRFLIKTAASSGSWIEALDKKMWEMAKSAEWIAWQLPVVPIGGWVWVNSVFGDRNSLKEKLIEKWNIADRMSTKNEDNLNEFLWSKRQYRDTDTKALQIILEEDTTRGDPNAFWTKSAEISNQVSWWLDSNNASRSATLESRRNQYGKGNSKELTIWDVTLKTDAKDAKEFITNNKDNIAKILKPK